MVHTLKQKPSHVPEVIYMQMRNLVTRWTHMHKDSCRALGNIPHLAEPSKLIRNDNGRLPLGLGGCSTNKDDTFSHTK